MKKIILAFALALSVLSANAQPKTVADAKKLVDKAAAAANDAKKAAKVPTWLSLANAYIGAYDQPSINLIGGTQRTEIKMILGKQQILSTDMVKVQGKDYSVDHYADKDLYYNEAGLLDFFLVTKPAIEGDLLGKAQDALFKAADLDTKGSKTKDIAAKLEDIHNKYQNEALNNYYLGNFEKSAELFEKSLSCFDNKIVGKVDSLNTYYTALVAGLAGKNDKAINYYKKCIDMGTYQEGNVFSNLSNIYLQAKDTASAKAVLEDGFMKYPKSQGVLIGLINLYRESGEDINKLLDLIHTAQANEPKNASLFYVEGDVYKKLGDIENAEKLFRKSTEIDPNYIYGVLSVGILYYDNAVDLQEKANAEMDDAKYQEYYNKMNESLKTAIAPFEESFNKTNDPEIKKAVAEYLKNIYFRFRTEDGNKEKYEFYENYLKN